MQNSMIEYALQAVNYLRAAYPNLRQGDIEWNQTRNRYTEVMAEYPRDVINSVIQDAPKPNFHPKHFPTLGEMTSMLVVEKRRFDEKHAKKTAPHQLVPYTNPAPANKDAQEAWVSRTPNKAHRLARLWACESRRLDLDPNEPSPPEIAKRRLTEIRTLLAEVG